MIVRHLINFTYVFCRVIPYKLIFVFVSRKKEIFEIDMKFFNCELNVKEKASKMLPTSYPLEILYILLRLAA